jgi:hypothetical protein
MVSEITAHRRAFFAFLAKELPALNARMEHGNEHSRWLAVGPMPLIAVHYVANGGVGLFKRGARRTRSGLIREYLFPHREFLAAALRRSLHACRRIFSSARACASTCWTGQTGHGVAWVRATIACLRAGAGRIATPVTPTPPIVENTMYARRPAHAPDSRANRPRTPMQDLTAHLFYIMLCLSGVLMDGSGGDSDPGAFATERTTKS